MARLIHKFRYSSPTNPTDCELCRLGGEWKVTMGDASLRGNTVEHWRPEDDWGYCFDDTKIAKHHIVLHPQLWGHPTKMNEIFFHELFHAIDHAETKQSKKGWSLPHSIIFRVSRALSKFMSDNNLELVQRKVIKSELSPILSGPDAGMPEPPGKVTKVPTKKKGSSRKKGRK